MIRQLLIDVVLLDTNYNPVSTLFTAALIVENT